MLTFITPLFLLSSAQLADPTAAPCPGPLAGICFCSHTKTGILIGTGDEVVNKYRQDFCGDNGWVGVEKLIGCYKGLGG